ncbi:SF1B family DNA helicase RecD2 [Candidatus Odyssella thessalonicensis]|uniref:SF1B family DNA helicase RecD2 n=1 Tax=Candidatus Odyssella thessalonicensis TaxID=84647 RepID=UPI000225AF36|nr:ATP-dependent RecD-like DNA helicase [Candidatus Odyssella thessalonicensis]
MQSLENISGIVERVTFHNEENGFCVLQVAVKGHKDLITIVGSLPAVNAGEGIEAQGIWMQDRQYGTQFKASLLKLMLPTTLEGIEKYLASGLISGIGPAYAKKLITAFRERIFDVIESNPSQLAQVPGIGPSRQDKIIKGWADQKVIREIMLFLHSHGVSTSSAVRIYKTYGNNAVQLIQSNPYRLAREIRGIGFKTSDDIAMHLGIAKDSLIRARAGVSHILAKAMGEGHCGLPLNLLLSSGQELLAINPQVLQQAVMLELEAGELIKAVTENEICIFLKELYHAEKEIAEKLRALSNNGLPWSSFNVHASIEEVEHQNAICLSASQKQALIKTLTHKVTIITGGPGVGKTTLLRSILQILKAKNLNLVLCAPTGRAAQRMAQATGMEAKTIHRLLNVNPKTGGFNYNEENLLPCNVIVIDEVSMVDVPLMHALLKAVPLTAAVIFVGDQDQLPSVGPGQVLSDFIAAKIISYVHLTETFRQGAQSTIVSVARSINMGVLPKLKGYGPESDFFFIEAPDVEEGVKQIIEIVCTRLPNKFGYSSLNDIQVLCPMTRGVAGSRNINMELQRRLNPPNTAKSIQKFGAWFSVGDKVMQIENNYDKEVYNGDIGFIQNINLEEEEVIISFDSRNIIYEFNDLDEIVLAYAMTIHKSQGSECPVVVIPLFMQHYPMLQKNLVYTAITRGKRLVILVGQKKALAIAVSNKNLRKRWSLLSQHLHGLVDKGETFKFPYLGASF